MNRSHYNPTPEQRQEVAQARAALHAKLAIRRASRKPVQQRAAFVIGQERVL